MYQTSFSMFAPFLIITGIILFVIGTIYLISRMHSDQVHLSLQHALEGYFYLVTVIGFVIFTFGLISLSNAAAGALLGKDFSYGRPPPYYPVPARPVPAYPPGVVPEKTAPLTMEQEEELRKKEEQRQIEENKRRQEQSQREELTQGIGMSFVGGMVWVLHLWGRRHFYRVPDSFSKGIRRSYLGVMLIIYSIMGITSITMAVSRILRQYILLDMDKYSFVPAPGPVVAASVIFIPVWIYYLAAMVNEIRKKENEVKRDTV